MKRIDALRTIVDLTPDLPIVVTLAATSRELAAIADRPNHFYLLDSMGLPASVGTGMALAIAQTSVEKLLVLEGDGSVLMNLGALATIGYLRPERLVMAILDNASYAATAGIPTYTTQVDLGAIAAACGIHVLRADDQVTLHTALQTALHTPGPHVLHVRIEPGNEPGIPLLLMDPVVLAARFQTWLRDAGAMPA